ncbi:MAG: hypothetical protein ACYCZJ_02090 [Sulfuriferula sp.]
MHRQNLFNAALTFAVTAGGLAWLAYHFAAPLIELLLPLFRSELHLLLPAFHIDFLGGRIEHNEAAVALTATLTEYRVVLGQIFPSGASVTASTLTAHAWVHPVLILALAASWPNIALKHRPGLMVLCLPVVLAEMLDIPLILWGAVEDVLYWQADPTRINESLGSRVQHFLDGGGRYVIPIVLAPLAIALFCKLVFPRKIAHGKQ